MKLFETPLYSFELTDHHILKFIWTPETKNMNFLNFQESCMIYAGLAIEHQVTKLLIDTRQFEFSMPENYMEWKEAYLNPRYAKVPVKKHAFIMPLEVLQNMEHQEFKESTYMNKFFDNEEKAIDWLTN